MKEYMQDNHTHTDRHFTAKYIIYTKVHSRLGDNHVMGKSDTLKGIRTEDQLPMV
jgi:hypothetical protein